jgi:hypothetical protein
LSVAMSSASTSFPFALSKKRKRYTTIIGIPEC